MLGLGLAGQGAPSALPAFARPAGLAADFATGLGVSQGKLVSADALITVQRPDPAHAQGLDGGVRAFSTNVARITSAGLWVDAGATRLHGEAPLHGAASGSGSASNLLATDGVFTPRLFASGGADWHQWRVTLGAIAVDEPRFFRVRYRAGTSGRCFISLITNTSPSNSYAGLAGPAGNLSVAGTSAGSVVDVVQTALSDGSFEVTGTFLPSQSAASATFGVGPHNAVAGETITLLGFQVTDRASQWVMGGGAATTLGANSSLIDLTGLNLADGFTLRLDGVLPTIHQADSYARFYQASPASAADRVQTYLRASDFGVGIEQHVGGTVQSGYPTLAVPVSAGAFSMVTGHGPNFTGGVWNGTLGAAVTAPAGYVPPTQIALGRDDLYHSAHAALLVTRFALYPGTPSQDRLMQIAAL